MVFVSFILFQITGYELILSKYLNDAMAVEGYKKAGFYK